MAEIIVRKISVELRRALKIACVRDGKTIQAKIIELIEKYITESK